jgi:hypothetical protein
MCGGRIVKLRRRATTPGGGARQSSHDLELGAKVWDAVGLYTKLGRRRSRLGDQGGGSGGHGGLQQKVVAATPACGHRYYGPSAGGNKGKVMLTT